MCMRFVCGCVTQRLVRFSLSIRFARRSPNGGLRPAKVSSVQAFLCHCEIAVRHPRQPVYYLLPNQLTTARPTAESRLVPAATRRPVPWNITTPLPLAPSAEMAMQTLAESFYLDSQLGAMSELPTAGSALENPYLYDSSAREMSAMAAQGLIAIVKEQRSGDKLGSLICRLIF